MQPQVSHDEHPDVPPTAARSRRRRALRSAAIGGTIGVIVVLGSFLIATSSNGAHWSASALSYTFFGGATGAVFGPLFTLARDDGDDAERIARAGAPTGRADASTAGALADDLREQEDRPVDGRTDRT
jgi:hypothetical protein